MVLNAKNQTLESAFTMFDADDDDMIAFDEFRWAILRIFRVEITENEVALYWKKLDLIDDKLSKKNFLLNELIINHTQLCLRTILRLHLEIFGNTNPILL